MAKRALTLLTLTLAVLVLASGVRAQGVLNENCTATIQNRTVQVNPDGTIAIPNVPVDQGTYRVRVVCREPGSNVVTRAMSTLVTLVPGGVTTIGRPSFDDFREPPVALQIVSFDTTLTSRGQTAQLTVKGFGGDNSVSDLTLGSEGTTYTSSNSRIATVSADGLVTAVSRGQAIISARNEGLISTITFNILVPVDADGDGMTDDFERANGLNPNDPTDAGQDADNDGLTNIQESRIGTNPRAADTDGDGLSDGNEQNRNSNPLRADTDGDGLSDGREVSIGSDLLNTDTDGDGITDGAELQLGVNPLVSDMTTTVQGRVVDQNGNPVAGASAILFNGVLTTNTDGTGFFTIPLVPVAQGNLSVLAQTIITGQLFAGMSGAFAPVANGTTDVGTIQLVRDDGTVTGIVTNPQNQPVAGAQVTVVSGAVTRSVMTDGFGRYRATNMIAGGIVVTVRDPGTALRGRATGTLLPDQPAAIDVRLAPSGSATGTIFNRDGVTPAGAGVVVRLTGAATLNANTNALGQYNFDFVPLGNYTAEASDAASNRGRASLNLSATGQTAVTDITFLGRGTVSGVVQTSANDPVPNAMVNLNSRSIFGGQQNTTTDAAGRYTFNNVFVGDYDVTARAQISRLGGQASGEIEADGDQQTTNITITASGTFTGTVFRRDGTTRVPNAQVTLSPTGLTMTADSQGNFRFEFIPVGSYTINVADTTTGDRGRATATINSQDQTVNVPVNMIGQGQVVVTVNDGGGNPVGGAQVTLTSTTVFGGSQQATTQTDGTATFTRVLAGGFNVSAFNSATQLGGSNAGSVTAGATANVTVQLQAAGSIFGTVFAPDGTTPVGNITVRIDGQISRQMLTNNSTSPGTFRFDGVPTGAYRVTATSAGNVRALNDGVAVATHGAEVRSDLLLNGIGTVTGVVRDPEGQASGSVAVSLVSRSAFAERTFNAFTDVNGIYTVQAPVGTFVVTANRNGNPLLFGTNQGEISQDGQTVQSDIQLSANLLPVTRTFFDANNLAYNLRENGSLQDGTTDVFNGDGNTNRGGALLDIVIGGTANRFFGQALATVSQQGRQIAIQQNNLGGLNVTRKIFVPRQGYFARYLEILSNPTAAPITADVRVTSNFRFIRKVQNGFTFDREPRITNTSSGDTQLDISDDATRDRWVTVDDEEDIDPFIQTNLPSVAHVFDGAGTPQQLTGRADYQIDFTNRFGRLVEEWQQVEIPAGGTVAFMHFVTEQTDRAAAQASAERLVQLPPEALMGANVQDLVSSYNELRSIVSVYGDSTVCQFGPYPTHLQDLDALNPSVQSLLTNAGDGALVRSVAAQVQTLATRIQNSSPSGSCTNDGGRLVVDGQLARSRAVETVGVASNLLDIGNVRNFVVPFDGGSVTPLPALNGSISGTVFAGDGATPIAGAPVRFQSANPLFRRIHTIANSAANGQFSRDATFNNTGSSVAIPVDGFTLQATHPQTNILSPVATGDFPIDNLASRNVVFSNSGIVIGTVRRATGMVVSSGNVRISGDEILTTANIATDGTFRFTGLPAGTYSLLATIPQGQGSPLMGSTTTQAADAQTSTADISVQPTGGVSGRVLRANGNPVVNIQVILRMSTLTRTTTTGTDGRFTFTDVPTGASTLEAFEQGSNTAASAIVNVVAEQTTTQDLTLTVGGTVRGIVRIGNQPVAGAQVTLTATNGTRNTTTAADGSYQFNMVALGNVSLQATDPATNLRGRASGSLGLSGETLTRDISLIASGMVSGTVFRAGGTMPVSGAQVVIRNNANFFGSVLGQTTTNAQGLYTLDFIPTGSFTVDVTDPANGDRGRASNQINANGESRTVNVTLSGFGIVVVTVRDAANNTVGGAQVSITGQGQFGGNQTATSQPDGTATFNNVFAGNFSVSATVQSGLGGSTNGNVAAGATANVSVMLQPAGTIIGRVFATDGTTPASGATVRLLNTFLGVQRETTSAPDGSFRFDAVPLGTYGLDALDNAGRLRTRITGINLDSNGDTEIRNLTFTGQGTVTGIVRNPNNSVAPNVSVSLRSTNTSIGGFFSATTNSLGEYTITNVPVGGFVATASNPAQQTQGETTGQITQDGQTITANIGLLNNAINLPANRFDASNFFFDLQGNGSIFSGTSSVYGGDFSSNRSAFFLDIISNGTPTRFTGGTIGTTEEGGREIAIRQMNLAGLDVTRKLFVPRQGYFARYLEILSNPTANPVTVDVRVLSNLRQFSGAPRIISTSSGNNTLDVSDATNPDRWVVTDDNVDNDPFLTSGIPAVAFAFDGAGGAQRAGAANFSTPNNNRGVVSYQWNSVTIAPGETIAFMHFGAQQASRAGAQASAERLVQLPPEALAGLSADEISRVRNFAIPAGGISALAPLPAINGAVVGRVLEADGTTTAAFGSVRFRSNNLLFGRTQFTSANVTGAFSFQSSLNDSGSSVAIPLDGFTLLAFHPQSNVQSPNVIGSFAANETSATRDILFTNTGALSGVVRRHTGDAVTTGGSVQVFRSGVINRSTTIAADGSFSFGGLLPGSYTLTAFANNPQGGTQNTGTRNVSVIAAQTTTADITLVATGSLRGVVQTASGNAAANVFVRVRTSGFSRSMNTNGSGEFSFSDVPIGAYTLEAFEPNTSIISSAQVTIAQDQETVRNLTLIALRQMQIQVNFANGSAAPNAQVNLLEAARGGFRFVGFTDSAGRLTVDNVAVGNFTVRGFHPNNTSLFTDVNGTLATGDGAFPVTVALPGTGVVTGRVTFPGGAAAVGAQVQIFGSNVPSDFTSTDSNGDYTFTGVVAGRPFTVRAFNPTDTGIFRDVLNNTLADGQTLTVNAALPAIATVRVTVLRSDNTPFSGARIDVQDSFRNFFRFAGNTDANGVLNIQNVPEGNFSLLARDPSSFISAGSVSGTVAAADHGQTIEVTINAPFSGNVTGTIFAGDGQTPLPFGSVQIFDVATNQSLGSDSADSNGNYQINGISPGGDGFRVRAFSPEDSSVFADVTGTITTTGETVDADVTLPVSVVKGRVTFSDGTTGVEFPDVFITQDGANRTFFTFDNDADGNYIIFGVGVGNFNLTAQDDDSGLTRTVAGTVTDVAVPVILNVTLPPSGTVNGTVRDAANNVVPFAFVRLSSANLSFERFAQANDQGVYSFDRIAVGAFTVRAEDGNNQGVFGTATGTLADDGGIATVNITLPPIGTVSGTIFESDGTTIIPNANVAITSGGLSFARFTNADSQGGFSFSGIPAGPFTVHAFANNPSRFGAANGTMPETNGSTVDADVTMPATAIVSGTILRADNSAVGGATGQVESFMGDGPFGHFSQSFSADSSGNYTVTGVPVGQIRVTGFDPNDFSAAGFREGMLPAAGFTGFNVTLGNAVRFGTFNLDGTDGFRYDVRGDGQLSDGGTVDRNLGDAYDGSYRLRVNSNSFNFFSSGLLEDGGREVVVGTSLLSNLNVTRKVFSPTAGGFARFLEVLSNPTASPITVTVEVQSNLGSDGSTRIVVPPSETSNRFAVTDQQGFCCDPALAHVFAGAGGSVGVSATQFINNDDDVFYRYNVTIPAGGTRIVMHFAVQRAVADTAGARTQAEALVNLSDPNALQGMSATERSQVVNFNVPAP